MNIYNKIQPTTTFFFDMRLFFLRVIYLCDVRFDTFYDIEFRHIKNSKKNFNTLLILILGDIGTLNTSHDMIKLMPKLKPQDVADAVLYAISTPENVLIHELIIKPVGEFL